MAKAEKIMAYNVKDKEKQELLKGTIDCSKNRYMIKGTSKGGAKLCVAVGKDKAAELVKAKICKKGTGWPKASKK